MPVDAEAWLQARNVARQPLWSTTPDSDQFDDAASGVSTDETSTANRTATAWKTDDHAVNADTSAKTELSDRARQALLFVRRSTMRTPQATSRLRDKLAQRGFGSDDIDQAINRATLEGIVDDDAIAHALVEEARRKGHGEARVRQDLARRGFDRAIIERQLVPFANEDPYAAAFDVAMRRAEQLSGQESQNAYRRVVSYVARRGYPDAVARKVARDAVFAQREPEWNASREA